MRSCRCNQSKGELLFIRSADDHDNAIILECRAEWCQSGQGLPSMQPPLDIPSRRPSASRPFFNSGDDPRFVGSPPAIDSEEHPSADTDDTRWPTTPTSASIQRRRVASAQTTSPALTSRNSLDYRDRNPEHQWTLFGQLMENEGHLASTSVTPTSNSRRPHRGTLTDSYFSYDARSVTGSSIQGSFDTPAIQASYSRHSRDASPVRLDPIPSRGALNDYDTDSSSVLTTAPPPPKRPWHSQLIQKLTLSPVSRNILKCAIAYFIASLFTFSPLLAQFISDLDTSGPSASAHMVATM
jgi:hypothetical protein